MIPVARCSVFHIITHRVSFFRITSGSGADDACKEVATGDEDQRQSPVAGESPAVLPRQGEDSHEEAKKSVSCDGLPKPLVESDKDNAAGGSSDAPLRRDQCDHAAGQGGYAEERGASKSIGE